MVDCPSMTSCNPGHKPLCARNAQGHVRSFNNPCVMRVINCKERTVFALIVAAFASDCPTVCTSEYRPVCARNTLGEVKTFATLCTLKAQNCLQKTDFAFEKDGAC
ncbi:vasotab [Neocloeon triangulifer]|uniref:vasotab n=1 Tax=Neocloeon triangulifer TaxID=2078957 RepID=UPI00286EC0C7|nr:vasotab [Neocloeon triangulifer]